MAGTAGWTVEDLAAAYLSGGARFLQLRAKTAAGGEFLDRAAAIVTLARDAGAIVVINDRADIAALAGADGVHVGQDDLPPMRARTLVGDAAMVGLSTHTEAQVDEAVREPISYIAIGPVFGTATKSTGCDAIGLQTVREAARRANVGRLPLVAIGGIALENAVSVIDAGAASVAVISDLLSTGDPERRVREFVIRLAASH